MRRNDAARARPGVLGDVGAKGLVGLLGVHPRVVEVFPHRVEHAGQRSEEVLVPVQLHDLVEAVPLDDLRAATRIRRAELASSGTTMLFQSVTGQPLYGSSVAKTKAATRIGGHVVAESLAALGAEVVFGIPGVHALPIWEGLRTTELRVLGFRQELNAGFAADGYARVTGRPTPLVVSTARARS